jgi:diguanylate cyclase (GGDEF)-like protein
MRAPMFLRRLFDTQVRSDAELIGYVARIAAVSILVALAVDICLHVLFFAGWTDAIRSWTVTTVLAAVISVAVARATGRAHLELYRAKLAVDSLSRTDYLTGLPNRRALFESADAPGTLVLVIADIDRFKRVNDTHGHLVGDIVIRHVGETMASELGALGTVGRLGGEEFALLAGDPPLAELSTRLQHFRERIERTPVVVGGTAIKVTISAGVATSRPGESFAQLYAAADRALYLAKAGGRNRICFAETVPLAREAHGLAATDGPGDRRQWRTG